MNKNKTKNLIERDRDREKERELDRERKNPNEDYLEKNNSQINRIFNWLIGLNMFRSNTINFEISDFPKICANGVFFSDLINRLEGVNFLFGLINIQRREAIKGIIRKTNNKSHIQVNVNKFLEYLRTLGKFNQRHLWSNDEICAGDRYTVWGLLEDIMNYYSKRTTDKFSNLPIKQKIRNSPEKSFNENFSLLQYSSLTSNNNSNRLNYNNTYKNDSNRIGFKELNAFSPINRIDDTEKDIKFNNKLNNKNSEFFKFNNDNANGHSRSNSKGKNKL